MFKKIFFWLFDISNPIGRNQRIMKKNWAEQTILYNRNTELTQEFWKQSYDLEEYKANSSRIKELEEEAQKIEEGCGHLYNS